MSGITIITFTDRVAEIVIDPTVKPVSAAELVRAMLTNGITAAKIVKSNPAIGRPGIQVARNLKDI